MQETRIYDYMIREGAIKCKWAGTENVIPICIGMKPRKKENSVVAYCVLSAVKGGLRTETFIINDTGLDVDIISFDLHTTIFLPENTNVFCNGYQSWSNSPMTEISTGLPKPSYFTPLLLKNSGDYSFADYARGKSHSWTYTYFEAPIGFTLLASLDESLAYTKFEFEYDNKRSGCGVSVTKDCSGLVLPPVPRTSGLEVPPVKILDLFMTTADESESFSSFFDLFYTVNSSCKFYNRSLPALAWDSWYALYNKVEENRLLTILNDYKIREIPLDYFIIGQGYESQCGDWTTPSINFPGGIKRVFDSIKAQIKPPNNLSNDELPSIKVFAKGDKLDINALTKNELADINKAGKDELADTITAEKKVLIELKTASKSENFINTAHSQKQSTNKITFSRYIGISPGITISPFICSSKSLLFQERKELLARNEKGRLIKVGKSGGLGGTLYLLDLYNIQAVNYIKRCIQTLTNDWGAKILKLDYLFAAGLNSGKHVKRTRAQAINHALSILRQTCPSTPIIACGVPIGSAIGLFEYCSIAPDLSATWDGQVSFANREGTRERESTLCAIKTTINRRHLDGKAFSSDIGSFTLRKFKTKLSSNQQTALYKTSIIFGGLITNADNVGTYGRDSLEQYRKAIAHRATRFNDKRVLSVETSNAGYHVKYALRNELHEDDIIL